MTEIEMTGFVTANMKARTVEDLRTLVGWLNKYDVHNSTEIEFDRGKIYIDLTGEDSVPADWIECGEHIPPDTAYHIVIDTHFHHEQPAKFDWLAKDRLKQAYKQAPDNYEEALEQGYDRYNVEGRPE
jgi:hypothetical protein